jgi:hypothetical protein
MSMPSFACIVPLLLLNVLSACKGTPEEPDMPLAENESRSVDGLVRFIGIEGGCWDIQAPGAQYQPVNLPVELKIDSLPVHAVVRGASGASICMVGDLVTLDSIARRQ